MYVAFIPARGGSKSIPLKNIKPFCGKPLIYWNLKALEDSPKVDRIYVSTDSNEIKSVVESFGMTKVNVHSRSSENASDTASTEAAMMEFIVDSDLADDTGFILVQATSPLTAASDFSSAIAQYESSRLDSMLTCVRIKRFFWSEDGSPINYNYNNRPRRQDFSGTLMENGAFYISKVSSVKKSKNRLSGKIGIFEMHEDTAVEIDEPNDWLLAEKIMKSRLGSEAILDKNIKLFLSDVDGTMTDSGMYYSAKGDEIKKFNTRDGKAFELLRQHNIRTGLITTEDTDIVSARALKIKADHVAQGVSGIGKLEVVKGLCVKEGISLEQVAYIGDDVNCMELLESVGCAACPADAVKAVKSVAGINVMSAKGGQGAVREFAECILSKR